MIVQWFPGHMTKALRMMEESVKAVESVIYILDSRAVRSSFNEKFQPLLKNKTVLYVLNKCDLVPEYESGAWLKYFEEAGKKAVLGDGAAGKHTAKIASEIIALNRDRIDSYKKKGVNKTVRAMVIGIPNSGKSTIINRLGGKKSAVTGDKAGVTKGKQWVKVGGGIELLDTPGTLCPAFENPITGLHLAYIGSVNDDAVDMEELALEFIREGMLRFPRALIERYRLTNTDLPPIEVYEQIARSRGFIMKGNEPDYSRTARALFDDFRKGKLGKIALETPSEDCNVTL